MVCARIVGRRGGRTIKLPLSVRLRGEIGSNASHVYAVSRVFLHGKIILGSWHLAVSSSSIAVVTVARGWFDHISDSVDVRALLNNGRRKHLSLHGLMGNDFN